MPEPEDEFDTEDIETLRDVIRDYRRRMAVKAQLITWGKYLAVASGVLVAIAQFRDTLRSWLQTKGGP